MYSRLGSNSMINVRYPFLRSTLLLSTGCSVTCRLCFWEYVWSFTLCRTRTVQISGTPNVRSVSYTKRIVALNPKSFVGIDKVIKENNNSTCQNIYLISVKTFLSILKQASRFFFVKRNLVKDTKKHSKFTVVEGFGNEFLRTSYVLLQEECEDRSLFSLYTSQMTDETKQEEHILASGRRRGKRKVFWTANPFLAGLQLVYRSCTQLTRRTRNHCYCPSLLPQSSFCIVRRCWK